MMLTLEAIRNGLADRRLDMVADATKLSVATIANVRSGRQQNPTYAVLKALSDYLTGSAVA